MSLQRIVRVISWYFATARGLALWGTYTEVQPLRRLAILCGGFQRNV